MGLFEIIRNLEGIECIESSAFAWKLRNERSKLELLRSLMHTERMLLEYGEDPIGDEIPGEWRSIENGVWVVPKDVISYFDDFAQWLQCGNWVLYSSPAERPFRLGSFQDTENVLRRMQFECILFCISSFYDNDPWFIFATRNLVAP